MNLQTEYDMRVATRTLANKSPQYRLSPHCGCS